MSEVSHEAKEIKVEAPFDDEEDEHLQEHSSSENPAHSTIKHEPLDIEPDDLPAAELQPIAATAGEHCFKCPDPGCSYTCELDGVLNMHIRLQHEGQPLGLIEPPHSVEDDSTEPTTDPTIPVVLVERRTKKRNLMHICSRCKKTFRKREAAEAHIATVHMVVKRFTCGDCGRGFNRMGDLEVHTRVHTGERPYKCPAEDCDYSASLSNTLQRHVRRRHKELVGGDGEQKPVVETKKQHVEDDSENPTQDLAPKKVNLTVPMLTASDKPEKADKPKAITTRSRKMHECTKCKVEFTKQASLRAHRNAMHGKEKIFNCTYCTVTFPSSRLLARHILLHDEAQASYPCTAEGCQFTFISEDDLKRHLKRHEKQTDPNLSMFGCDVCGKQFELRCGLMRHISALHPREDPIVEPSVLMSDE